MGDYSETSGELARQAGVTQPTVRKYADAGLLKFIRSSNGTRLFLVGQAEKVREIYKQRMALRGKPLIGRAGFGS